MTTTENNLAAQAGDEPMREAFETHIRSLNPKQLFVARWSDGSYKHHGTDGMWAGWQAAMASQVSPRATADVERDAARWNAMMRVSDDEESAVEVFNQISRDLPDTDRRKESEIMASIADAIIATTKPGA